jgi:hypothetical protein
MSQPKLISLQSKIYLSEIVNGVEGAPRFIGNVPDFMIKPEVEKKDHFERYSGERAKDATLFTTKQVMFSGTMDQINAENIAYILAADTPTVVATNTVSAESLGTVTAGQTVFLGNYGITGFTLVDSAATPATVESSKYTFDARFGTLIVNDVAGLTMPLKWSGTTAANEQVGLLTNVEKEYKLTAHGIDTASKRSYVVELWRTRSTPNTEFGLIHEEFGVYKIEGDALADPNRFSDTLGAFGKITEIA